MMRLLMRLFGKEYEPCKTCAILLAQLEQERQFRHEMFDAYKDLASPPPAPAPVALSPREQLLRSAVRIPSRLKADLERRDAERVRMEKNSIHLAKSDNETEKPTVSAEALNNVDKLEQELGIGAEEGDSNASRSSDSNG